MARLQDIAAGRKDLYMLDPLLIQEEPGWNVRLEGPDLDAHIRLLADSIKQIGVQEPLTVYMRDNTPVLTNGHCRLAAVKLAISEGAEIKAVPVRTEERYANEADRVLSLITRNSGKPLAALEQAEVVKRLMGFGWSEQEIVKKTGFSTTHLDNLMKLSAAPVAVTELVKNGKVSARLAMDTLRSDGDQAAETLRTAVETAEQSGKSRATAKHLPKPVARIDWKWAGPHLKKALEDIRDAADNPEELTVCIAVAVKLLEMVSKAPENSEGA